jgi:hypothetical protein
MHPSLLLPGLFVALSCFANELNHLEPSSGKLSKGARSPFPDHITNIRIVVYSKSYI